MIKNINAANLIGDYLFVKEPVNQLYKRINELSADRIILTGGRGVGKSVVLLNKERNDLVSDDKSIFIDCVPSSCGEDSSYDEKFVTHYYEMLFSLSILKYIKRNYELTYNKYFVEMDNKLKKIIHDTLDYINNVSYMDVSFNNYLSIGDISSCILDKFKNIIDVNTLTLMIDRFDSIDGTGKTFQKSLSNYFEMFDRVILSSDDIDLLKENRDNLVDKTYTFIDIDYSKNPEVVKEILYRRILNHNLYSSTKEKLSYDLFNDEIYKYITDKCNGDIKIMLDVLRDIINDFCFYGDKYDLSKDIVGVCNGKVKYYQDIRQLQYNKPCLHLVKK